MGKVISLNPYIPKGTTITCPQCSTTLYTFSRTIKKTNSLPSSALSPRPLPKSDMQCEHCKAYFALITEDGEMKLHTVSGWILATA